MVSSKFDLSCLAPTDNSLTKTFLLLLHFSVFCAFIITPHFYSCKHFLTFIFRKYCNWKKKSSKQGANFTYSILKFFFLSPIRVNFIIAFGNISIHYWVSFLFKLLFFCIIQFFIIWHYKIFIQYVLNFFFHILFLMHWFFYSFISRTKIIVDYLWDETMKTWLIVAFLSLGD